MINNFTVKFKENILLNVIQPAGTSPLWVINILMMFTYFSDTLNLECCHSCNYIKNRLHITIHCWSQLFVVLFMVVIMAHLVLTMAVCSGRVLRPCWTRL